jgi:hypothetical protein
MEMDGTAERAQAAVVALPSALGGSSSSNSSIRRHKYIPESSNSAGIVTDAVLVSMTGASSNSVPNCELPLPPQVHECSPRSSTASSHRVHAADASARLQACAAPSATGPVCEGLEYGDELAPEAPEATPLQPLPTTAIATAICTSQPPPPNGWPPDDAGCSPALPNDPHKDPDHAPDVAVGPAAVSDALEAAEHQSHASKDPLSHSLPTSQMHNPHVFAMHELSPLRRPRFSCARGSTEDTRCSEGGLRGGSAPSGPPRTIAHQDVKAADSSFQKRTAGAEQAIATPPAWCSAFWRIANGLLNVPTAAIAVGLVIACTPVLRRAFYGPDDPEEGASANEEKGDLDVVTSALRRLGDAAIPCMMIGIGGALSKGPGNSQVPWKAIVALALIRLVVLPAAGGWAVLAAQSVGLWEDNGKMFTLVLLLQQAMPTALNVHTMAAMHQNNEEVVAVLLFWQYIACIFTIPVCVLVFLSRIVG